MSRPLRIEFPGAVYHVTSRGDRQEPIFLDDLDRRVLMDLLAQAMSRFEALAHAWCLMGNHFHIVLQTAQPNLSRLMRHLNGVYTQRFNRRHGKVGHVFQGRYHAVLVDTESYLLQACRYVELNPVRAGLVTDPQSWEWSSARARTGASRPPEWLAPHPFGQSEGALCDYRAFLSQGIDDRLWEDGLRQQIYLGPQSFVQRVQAHATARPETRPKAMPGVPRAQQRPAKALSEWLGDPRHTSAQAIQRAHHEGHWTVTAIAHYLGVSVATASRRLHAKRPGSGLVSCSHPAKPATNKT